METIILASASPRRQELLQQIGVPYEVVKSDAEEVLDAVEGPRALAVENARRKALTVAARYPGRVVLGADTVVFQDGAVYGKPKDAEDARSMLKSFAGRRHDVVTGVAIIAKDGTCYTDAAETKVSSRRASRWTRRAPMPCRDARQRSSRASRARSRMLSACRSLKSPPCSKKPG